MRPQKRVHAREHRERIEAPLLQMPVPYTPIRQTTLKPAEGNAAGSRIVAGDREIHQPARYSTWSNIAQIRSSTDSH